MPKFTDPALLSAAIPFADAGVYRISDELALVQSLDFFTPVVDDPYLYGQIAAANSLSDVFAMGARPLTAMNIVAFPACSLGPEVLAEILRGGADKVLEAGAVIVGGHSVEDAEPKYGLSVTGLVHPDRLLSTVGARPGDALVLTKALGTGLLTTALKGEVLDEAELDEAVAGMCRLNKAASEAALAAGVNACTDITGFGLVGHALEMAEASLCRLEIDLAALPAYPRALEMADLGLLPEGGHRNRKHYLPRVEGSEGAPAALSDLLCDPQTSGGLLLSVAPERLSRLLSLLAAGGDRATVIGRVSDEAGAGLIVH